MVCTLNATALPAVKKKKTVVDTMIVMEVNPTEKGAAYHEVTFRRSARHYRLSIKANPGYLELLKEWEGKRRRYGGGVRMWVRDDTQCEEGGEEVELILLQKMLNFYFIDPYLIYSSVFPCIAGAQIITTIAGSGSAAGFSGDGGPATAALMGRLFGLACDAAGNIYVSDFTNNRIRKVNTSGVISTYAGNGSGSTSGDGGPATAAGLNGPSELALYGNSLFIAEHNSSRVRKVDITTGIITTYAGTGLNGYSGDGGPATAAKISRPYGIGVDNAGNVYIPDQDTHRMRKVDTFGIITTFAGTGTSGYSGDGGPATLAKIHLADDIKCDTSGNIYFCDFLNDAVRKIDTSGIITTIAGTGIAGFSGDGGPATATPVVWAKRRASRFVWEHIHL